MLENQQGGASSDVANRRVSITKRQRESDIGAELLSLCQSTTADGTFSDEEISFLREWLATHRNADLPAISHLLPVVEQITADGKITPEERREMYLAVESVLPPDVRSVAKRARRSIEQQEQERVRRERAIQRERAQQDRIRNESLLRLDFMVAGVRHEGRPVLIEKYARDGDEVKLTRDAGNPFSSNAVEVRTGTGHHIGFVPEEDAAEIASMLDDGYPYRAKIKKILTGGRYPIPVVVADVYLKHADVPLLSWPQENESPAVQSAQPIRAQAHASDDQPRRPRTRQSYRLGRYLGRHATALVVIIVVAVAYLAFR